MKPFEKKLLCLIVALSIIVVFSFGAFAQDRMPAIPLDKMNALQKKYADEIIKGPRGALYNPFTTLIRSPELMDRAQKIGEYLRYKSAIGTRLTELVILIVARQWTQQVEWAIHEPIALKEGIKPDVILAIADGRRPVGMSDDEEMIYNFCTELHTNKSITDVTYDRVLKRFGEQGVIDTLGINGYYTFLAMVMNGTRTAVPDNKPGALKPFPK
ncbi:MAG TPA: carboxymuconolactone decarboxylase family protein [Syntrophales bacterium]|nr:carboxymuconolactone decarboxylase family protein [Syntrophales bacterium]